MSNAGADKKPQAVLCVGCNRAIPVGDDAENDPGCARHTYLMQCCKLHINLHDVLQCSINPH